MEFPPTGFSYGFVKDKIFYMSATNGNTVLVDSSGKVIVVSGPPVSAIKADLIPYITGKGVDIEDIVANEVVIALNEQVDNWSTYTFISG